MSDDRVPEELSVRDAAEMFITRARREFTDATVTAYRLDLRQFVQWCEREGIDQISELVGYDFERYEAERATELASTSLENQMGLLKRFIEFCEDIGAVDDDLHETVHVPKAPPSEQSRDERLAVDDAIALLSHFRDHDERYGTKWHALLEVLWHTGCRLGGLRALDLTDYDREFRVLEFRHRPNQATPLKNKLNGERDVGILEEVGAVLDAYIEEHRFDRHDDEGRAPLFTTRSTQGRLSKNAVRGWCYQATQPCWYQPDPCPHDKQRRSCSWTALDQSSKCPSVRSPHAVRTGAITFHQNRGFDPKDTAERVNASLSTIEKHYDKASRREEMETRRRPQLDLLSLDED